MEKNFIIQAENSIAGALLIEPENVLSSVRDIVRESDFLSEYARAIFTATAALVDHGKPCDANLIREAAGDAVTVEYCQEAMNVTPTIVNAAEYARIVHEAAQARRAQEIGAELVNGEKSPVEALAQIQELIRNQGSTMHTPGETAQMVMDSINEAANGKKRPFTATGIKRLDAILSGGFPKGGLITIAARPGTGKSTVAITLADKMTESGGPVLYFSLEMTALQIWLWRLASSTGLSRSDIYTGRIIKDSSWKKIGDSMIDLSERPFFICDTPSSMEDIERQARSVKNLSLIVVDHIGLVKSKAPGTRYEIMTDTAHRLKQLALSLQIPILALCQLNRQSLQRDGKRPTMADRRDSGAIEEDSDVVCLLFREAEYRPKDKQPKPWELQTIDFIVDKNRHGMTGIVQLEYCPMNARILEDTDAKRD